MKFKLIGRNNRFPDKIDTWKFGENPVPEWLSEIAKVSSIDPDNDTIQLDFRKTNTGGIEILDSSGKSTLVKLETKDSYVCKNLDTEVGGIFALTPKQLELLYMNYEV